MTRSKSPDRCQSHGPSVLHMRHAIPFEIPHAETCAIFWPTVYELYGIPGLVIDTEQVAPVGQFQGPLPHSGTLFG